MIPKILDNNTLAHLTKENAINNAISILNRTWASTYGYFDVRDVVNCASQITNKAWLRDCKEYNYLNTFHCTDWRHISEESLLIMAATIIVYFDNSRIGYDYETKRFVDLQIIDDTQSVISLKTLSPNKVKNFTSSVFDKLMILFRQKSIDNS